MKLLGKNGSCLRLHVVSFAPHIFPIIDGKWGYPVTDTLPTSPPRARQETQPTQLLSVCWSGRWVFEATSKSYPCTQCPARQQACSLVGGNCGKMRRGQLAYLECKQTMKLVRDWLRCLLLMMEGVYNMEIKITQLSCLLGRQWLIRCLTARRLLITEQPSPSDCKPQP